MFAALRDLTRMQVGLSCLDVLLDQLSQMVHVDGLFELLQDLPLGRFFANALCLGLLSDLL